MPNFSNDPDSYPSISDSEIFRPSATLAAKMPNNEQQARIDAAINEMAEKEREAAESTRRELEMMNEARTRFAKAALYEQLIEGQLFEGNDPLTLQVEEEMKAFAEERYMALLGLQSNKKVEAQLDDEEVGVLKMFAAKLLGRQVSMPRYETPQVAVKPVVPAAPPAAALAAPKRGRGRPPGTGKNQKAAAALAAQQAQAPDQVVRTADQSATTNQVAVTSPTTRQVSLPNGKTVTVQVQPSQVRPTGPGPKPVPMPSPEEMVGLAMAAGEAGFRDNANKLQNLTKE